jgi:hypothetical protein
LQIGVLAVPILQLATTKKKREESKLTIMWYEYSKSFVSNRIPQDDRKTSFENSPPRGILDSNYSLQE